MDWRDRIGTAGEGSGQALPFSDESGFFWFFDERNLELVVKVLDGRPLNDHFWFFYGALSDVEYSIEVRDRLLGTVRSYQNPQGNLCGQADILAFPESAGAEAPVLGVGALVNLADEATTATGSGDCVPGPRALCLRDGRFRVEVEWRDQHNAATGDGQAVPGTGESGFFWFFDESNVELIVKILDGQPLNGKFWVFYGALTDVEYWITVTDTETGAQRMYHNAPGNLCGRGDIEGF